MSKSPSATLLPSRSFGRSTACPRSCRRGRSRSRHTSRASRRSLPRGGAQPFSRHAFATPSRTSPTISGRNFSRRVGSPGRRAASLPEPGCRSRSDSRDPGRPSRESAAIATFSFVPTPSAEATRSGRTSGEIRAEQPAEAADVAHDTLRERGADRVFRAGDGPHLRVDVDAGVRVTSAGGVPSRRGS